MIDNKEKEMSHSIVLENRNLLSLTGVKDVDSFDENSIVAYTDFGELTVNGSNLHISTLNTDSGELSIDGDVSSLIYLDNKPKSEGFLKKVFR